MDFITELRNKTIQELTLFAPISPMILPVNDKGIAIRPSPSTDENWQFDGGYTGVIGIQLLVRSNNWLEAWTEINKINNLWNGADRLFIEGLTVMRTTTRPNWVGVDDHNRHEYSALYQAEIEQRRN